MFSCGVRPPEGLQSSPEIVCVDEVCEMSFELGVIVVMATLHGGLLDCPVHPLDLSVRPRMPHLRQPLLDAIFPASHVEHVGHASRGRSVGLARRKSELDAVVRENRMNFILDSLNERDEER